MKRTTSLALAAAVLVLAPAAAVAQNDLAEKADEVTQKAEEVRQNADDLTNDMSGNQRVAHEEEDGFDWGLLGLLGLAGLLGLRKKEGHDRDVHVDARRDTRM